MRVRVGAIAVAVAIAGCGSGDEGSGTFSMDCYEFMNTPEPIQRAADTERNDRNFERCQQSGQENTVLDWDEEPEE